MTRPKLNSIFRAALFLYIAAFSITGPATAQRTVPPAYSGSIKKSYIRTWDATAPESDPIALMSNPLEEVKQATQYFDGLGRPLQVVVKKGSWKTGTTGSPTDPYDLVSATEYNEFGLEQFKYLPFVANTAGSNTSVDDGLFKTNPFVQQEWFYDNSSVIAGQGEDYFYGITEFETSPLGRVKKAMSAGDSWAGNSKGVETKYYANKGTDDVRKWIVEDVTNDWGTYSSPEEYDEGELFKTVSVDEEGKQVVVFTDKDGLVVLKKVQLLLTTTDNGSGSGHDNWLCTYYIYDDLNNLRCVIQPEGVNAIEGTWIISSVLSEQCFRYEYDEKNRLIRKKVPGMAELYMIYDKWDRIILMQDGILRPSNQWIFTKYDQLNRPIMTGLHTDATNTGLYGMITHVRNSEGSLARFENIDATKTHKYTTTLTYPSVTTPDVMTVVYYDDYALVSGSGLNSSFLTTWNTHFYSSYNTSPEFAQPLTQSARTRGLPTITKTRVLGTSTFLYSVNIYDEKARIIQIQSTNITGGVDVATTQFSWNGLPIIIINKTEKAASPAQTSVVVTKMSYDNLWRLVTVQKKLSHTGVSNGNMSVFNTIVTNKYDELGRLDQKELGSKKEEDNDYVDPREILQTLDYDYNIRSSLIGMNRDYLISQGQTSDGVQFGFELGYDKTSNKTSEPFIDDLLNGNISGMVWKSNGDDIRRKYDFGYDAANRLMKADFEQHNESGTWNNTDVNYSIKMGDGSDPTTAYDLNGNILTMQQWGLKITGSAQIDHMRYTYISDGNRLKSVTDFDNDPQTVLGDFRTVTTHPNNSAKAALTTSSSESSFQAITDYAYDANGNLTTDNNKEISSITYNHLNLPVVVAISGNTITYTYDATGTKLKKVVYEDGTSIDITTTTTYFGGIVYETKSDNDANTTDYTDRLQFIAHEEGRIRYIHDATKFEYDYFIKDHLGNVRMVLSEQNDPATVYQATMETGNQASESSIFENITTTDEPKPTGFDSDSNNGTVSKLFNATGNDKRQGPALVLKVMAGDKFKANVYAWYQPGATDITTLGGANSILTGLISTFTGWMPPGSSHVTGQDLSTNNTLNNPITDFLANQPNGANLPRAYLNWMVLDEAQFKLVQGNFSATQVPEITGVMPKQAIEAFDGSTNDIEIKKNGYLFVYVSNESKGSVYFDQLHVEHKRGPLVEETHYYPFGLTMMGISHKCLGIAENKWKFNDATELNRDFNINLYETDFRTYDPQIGRLQQIDLLIDEAPFYSPYVYADNNPILLNDPLGLFGDTTINGNYYPDAKELENVFFLSSKDERIWTTPGLTIINKPRFAIKKNDQFNPLDNAKSNDNSLVFVKTFCDDKNCSHDHKTAELIMEYGGEITTAPVPISKIKWLGRLFKGSKFLTKYQKLFVLSKAWKKGKWGDYMTKRGWTFDDIARTLEKGEWKPIGGKNYLNPGNSMSAVTDPKSGKFIIIDNVTKDIIQLGGVGHKL